MRKNENQKVSDRLHEWWDDLSEASRQAIAGTDIDSMAYVFDGLRSPDEVNAFTEENEEVE